MPPGAEFSSFTFPKARKEYRCEWCGEFIPKGEKHMKFTGVWQGDFNNFRMHSECHEAADASEEMSDGFSAYEHERPPIEERT